MAFVVAKSLPVAVTSTTRTIQAASVAVVRYKLWKRQIRYVAAVIIDRLAVAGTHWESGQEKRVLVSRTGFSSTFHRVFFVVLKFLAMIRRLTGTEAILGRNEYRDWEKVAKPSDEE